jgi:ribosome biogenesis GTPase A
LKKKCLQPLIAHNSPATKIAEIYYQQIEKQYAAIKNKQVRILVVGLQGTGKSALINLITEGTTECPLPSAQR